MGLRAMTVAIPLDEAQAGRPRVRRSAGTSRRAGRGTGACDRGAAPGSRRALRAPRRGRLDVGRTPPCARSDSAPSAISCRRGSRRASSGAARGEPRGRAAGGTARGADRGRERLRYVRGLGCRRPRARPVPAVDVVRVVESVASRRARSTRTPRSTRRPATCGGSSTVHPETWAAPSPPTTTAGAAARVRPGRPRRVPTWRASCAGSEARRSSSRTPRSPGWRAAPSGPSAAAPRVPRASDSERVISDGLLKLGGKTVDMPPQGS